MKEILSMDNVSYSYDSEDEDTQRKQSMAFRLLYKTVNGLRLLDIMVLVNRHLRN